MNKYFSILCAYILFSGCAQIDSHKKATTLKLSPIENATYLKHIDTPKSLYLQLGIIVGGLYGSPAQKPKQLIEISNKSPASLDIPVLEGIYGPLSTSITKEAARGLIISPDDTQILRLSTFGLEPLAGKMIPGGLLNKAGDFIMLVYFDRPCTIGGSVEFSALVTAHHSIKIEKAGIYKIVSAKTPQGFEVSVENNNDPIRVELGDSLFRR